MIRTVNGTTLRLCAIVFTLSWAGFGSAQDMRDHWILSQGSHVVFTASGPEFLGQVPLRSLEGLSSISDSTGKLLAYAQPMVCYHAGMDTMKNGFRGSYCVDPETGSSTTQGSMLLPSQDGDLNLFSIRGGVSGCFQYLFQNRIDMSLEGGLGNIIDSNGVLLYPHPVNERLTAVKHGNGKDWWLLATNATWWTKISSQLLVFLLQDDEVTLVDSFRIGYTRQFGELVASPDGTRLALANFGGRNDSADISFALYDFDRCSGSISNEEAFRWNRGTYGVSFSPSGRFLYLSISNSVPIGCGIVQVDIEDSLQSYEVVYDCSDLGTYTTSGMEMGPDGSIYFRVASSGPTMTDSLSWYLNAILEPDSLGLESDVRAYYVKLETGTNGVGLPNHPNYYLGPDPRCSGDTTTTDTTSAIAPVLQVLSWKVYPTVAEGTVTVETSSPGGDITVLGAMGKTMLSTPIEGRTTILETGAWPGGVYLVVLSDNRRVLGTRTVIRPW
jgi:hypothetical protein